MVAKSAGKRKPRHAPREPHPYRLTDEDGEEGGDYFTGEDFEPPEPTKAEKTLKLRERLMSDDEDEVKEAVEVKPPTPEEIRAQEESLRQFHEVDWARRAAEKAEWASRHVNRTPEQKAKERRNSIEAICENWPVTSRREQKELLASFTPDFLAELLPELEAHFGYRPKGAKPRVHEEVEEEDTEFAVANDTQVEAANTGHSPNEVVYMFRGRPMVKDEWVPGLVAKCMGDQRPQALCTAKTIEDLFAEVLYWAKPDRKGLPRASGKRREFIAHTEGDSVHDGVCGFWFVRLHRKYLVNRYSLTRWQVDRAFDKLVEIRLVATQESAKSKKWFWVRPRFDEFAPYVANWVEDNRARLEASQRWKQQKSKQGQK